MKKLITLFTIATLAFSLCACKDETKTDDNSSKNKQNNGLQQDIVMGSNHESEELHFLSSLRADSGCNTENGYYYLTEDIVKLRDGNYGMHLMYMDFATCREIYLCSTSGCGHDSADCPAVFLYDDFPNFSTKLFIYKNQLYILSREYDNDGSANTITIYDSNTFVSPESKPAVLYRANLDGTERKKIYIFDADITLEESVLGDDNGIYVITKKLSADKKDNVTYTTSSERKLMFLDIEEGSIKEVCSMNFGDNISWNVIGCNNGSLILNGIDFGREITQDEKWDDDTYKNLFYEKSYDVYAVLDLKNGELNEICRIANKVSHSGCVIGDMMYISYQESQVIESISIDTGEKKTVCTLEQNLIMDTLGDILCCRGWDLAKDFTYYFVNTKTGEISHSTLVNQNNGWNLEFRAELESDVLLVYDYDAKKNNDNSYEIYQYKYALISKADLFKGNGNYRKIEMLGKGQ